MAHRWYIVQAVSGAENKVKQAILDEAAKLGLTEAFEDIVIPAVEAPEIKKGKKVVVEKKLMPGYILIKMDMTDETWHLVKNVTKVTNFLGSGTKPHPVPNKQIEEIFGQIESKSQNSSLFQAYEVGEEVKVIDGPFESFSGTVEEVDGEKSRLRVSVSIFGRATPLDLDFTQVQKL